MPLDLRKIDRAVASTMRSYGTTAVRISLAIIFIWFGILKPLGISPAANLVKATVHWLPPFAPETWVVIIGWWEVAIGVTFLFHATIRVAIALLFLQMAGTFMPLFVLSDVTFQTGRFPYAPTLAGQYVIKNILILSAALVVGGTARRGHRHG